jgi:hypothetical protein
MQKLDRLSALTYECSQVTESWALVSTTPRQSLSPDAFMGTSRPAG